MNFNDIKNKAVSFLHDFENDEQKRNKFLVFFLLFIGVCSVIAGFSNTRESLRKPFIDKEKEAISSIYDTYNDLKKSGKIEETNKNLNTTTNSNTYNEESKTIDTDGDGLFDYDEANIFKTSAFLKDSDADGISDFDEIKNGTDANCPVGKNCSSSSVIDNNQTTTSDIKYNAIDVEKMDIKQARIELEKIIPEDLKPLLSSMTDEQIKSLMLELYSNTSNAGNNNSTNSNNQLNSDYVGVLKSKLPKFTTAQLSTIKDMSELEIKKLLLDSNIADSSLLSQFKTGELKSTVLGE